MTALRDQALALDAADPLGPYRSRFLDSPGLVAYLDGNSLGRPLATTASMLDDFVRGQWAGRLIQGWTDGWLDWPLVVGDRLGAAVLGAAAGQVVVADSTTVLLYKLARAAVDARPGRTQVVLDTDNFPTDRYVLEGIAAERGLELVWVTTDPAAGVLPSQVASVVGPSTALVVFSHVAYRSGFVADCAAITALAHNAGALALWDLSHSVGSVPLALDAWGVDLAVGCTYKYLNGGPGAPAFAYARAGLPVQQPIWGWMGRRDPFEMGPGYTPVAGVRSLLSGTPPILGMLPLLASLDLVEEVGMTAIRAKSLALTSYALELVDAWLVPMGVSVDSPRSAASRGGHVTVRRAGFASLLEPLWAAGVVPDYRAPDALRLGLSPLSTSFVEVYEGVRVIADLAASL
ncbi:aminotransferase class V-fold PLP-dependent enzyme [Acidothermaceae bacterium B102]|nr:aminotransferase class V-fold PLP-dependent enzyme [Acidothermaceae bacterium B102]